MKYDLKGHVMPNKALVAKFFLNSHLSIGFDKNFYENNEDAYFSLNEV